MKKRWEPLKKGDIIDIIAPASNGFSYDDIAEIKQFLSDLGLQARVAADIVKTSEQLISEGLDPFCANSDEYRFNHLKEALFATDSKAIWCMRGGYGSMRLIPKLIKLTPPSKAKLFLGFSDITALLLFLTQNWQWITIHGKGLAQFTSTRVNQISIEEYSKLLFGQELLHYTNLLAMNDLAKQNSLIEGELIGGNLSLLQTSIGTSWQVDAKDKILFIEDVDERGYKVDRMLEHLKQAGIFSSIKALIIGDFTRGNEKDGSNYINYAINRICQQLTVPVISFTGIGHEDINHPLPLGSKVNLKITANKIILECESGIELG